MKQVAIGPKKTRNWLPINERDFVLSRKKIAGTDIPLSTISFARFDIIF